MNTLVCSDLSDLTRRAEAGAATALLTEESLSDTRFPEFLKFLRIQPDWSDLPVVLLMRGAVGTDGAAELVASLGNVTLLERPAPLRSVVSAVQAAVRGRFRQYQIRDQIHELRAASEEKKQLLAREQAAREEAERAGRIKDEFLATLSHELRTPLNAILGWASLLKQGRRDLDSLDEGLTVIERNARVQSQLISDLLDMSRIISGKVHLEMNQIDPAEVIRSAAETVQPTADAKGVDLRVFTAAEALPFIGDSARLQQIVWNLLTNAIKFTPKDGRVDVRLKRIGSNLQISVADTGVGITADFLPYVFERFRQADASTTRQFGGLGLGLAIVKQLVEMHGGYVRVESEGAQKGATFFAVFPIRAATTVPHPQPPRGNGPDESSLFGAGSAQLRGMKILVVDDESDARGLIKRILEECKADVVTAPTASDALEQMERWRPDVIVSDIGMPRQDGYEFLRLARMRGISAPALALTAFARMEDHLRSIQVGYDNYLTKPVEPHVLIRTLADILRRHRSKKNGRTPNPDSR